MAGGHNPENPYTPEKTKDATGTAPKKQDALSDKERGELFDRYEATQKRIGAAQKRLDEIRRMIEEPSISKAVSPKIKELYGKAKETLDAIVREFPKSEDVKKADSTSAKDHYEKIFEENDLDVHEMSKTLPALEAPLGIHKVESLTAEAASQLRTPELTEEQRKNPAIRLVRENRDLWKFAFADQGIDVPDSVMEIFFAREIQTTQVSKSEKVSEYAQDMIEQVDPLNMTDFSVGMFQIRPSVVRKVLFKNGISTSTPIDGLMRGDASEWQETDSAVASQLVASPETSFIVAIKILCQYYKEALAECQSNRGIPINYKQGDRSATAYLPIENGKVQLGGKQYPAEQFIFLTACAKYRYKTGTMSLASKDKPEYLFEDNGKQYIDTSKYQDIQLNQIDENILSAWK